MARIPQILSAPEDAGVPQSGGPALISPNVGNEVGTAQRELGAAAVGLGVSAGNFIEAEGEKQNKSTTASGVANFDFTKDFIDLQKNAPQDGNEFKINVANAYDKKVDDYVQGMPSDEVRNRVRQHLMSAKPQYMNAAAAFSDRQGQIIDKTQADAGLDTQANRVASDPSLPTFDDAVTKSNAVIDARPNFTPAQKEAAKRVSIEQLSLRRFEGMTRQAALDPTALDGIETELKQDGSVWKERLSKEGYNSVLDKVTTLKHAANSQENTDARAVIQGLKQRNTAGEEIPEAELQAGQLIVQKSTNGALLSEFAMIGAQQKIYRDTKGLPLEQQRALIEDAKKKGALNDLPETIKNGIAKGSALTNGVITPQFLAGLTHAEYGQYINGGDYGKGTDAKTSAGKPGSDALGVSQFTSTTFLQTVKAHVNELPDAKGKTDAQILEMRKDETFSLQAAALHAMDNKRDLEAALGRPANDGDLYFAHFLGAAGATRFLQAAVQNPRALAKDNVAPDQVDANRGVFYDEAGRPRTNWQVQSFISDKMMNGQSRVGYAELQARTAVLAKTEKALKEDPMTFASTSGRFGNVGDFNSPEGIARRGVASQQVAEFYGIPASKMKPLTANDVEALAKRARDGTAEETLGVMTQIQGLGVPAVVKAANAQIAEKDSLFGHAAGLAYDRPDQVGVAADIIRGEKRMKNDKDVLTSMGETEPNRIAAFNQTVGKALGNTGDADGGATMIRKAADAYYVQHFLINGASKQGAFNSTNYTASINAVLGGSGYPNGTAVENVNGEKTWLPRGLSGNDFEAALKRMGPGDYVASSQFGGSPHFADGTTATPEQIAREGKFVAIGNSRYTIKMADGKNLITGLYANGRTDNYVFVAKPDILKSILQRPDRDALDPKSYGGAQQ